MSDAELERLAHADYWDEQYSTVGAGQQFHEWFRSFEDLAPWLGGNLLLRRGHGTRILHLGSGDSTVPEELAARGFDEQLCVDFSPVVVKVMTAKHATMSGIEWRKEDVRHMASVPSESIDVAFDKGTLDAMIHGSPWSPPDDVKENTSQYLQEVHRVLKPDGMFLYITYRQPHFIKPLLDEELWDIKIDVLGGGGSFGYHGFTLTKKAGDKAEDA